MWKSAAGHLISPTSAGIRVTPPNHATIPTPSLVLVNGLPRVLSDRQQLCSGDNGAPQDEGSESDTQEARSRPGTVQPFIARTQLLDSATPASTYFPREAIHRVDAATPPPPPIALADAATETALPSPLLLPAVAVSSAVRPTESKSTTSSAGSPSAGTPESSSHEYERPRRATGAACGEFMTDAALCDAVIQTDVAAENNPIATLLPLCTTVDRIDDAAALRTAEAGAQTSPRTASEERVSTSEHAALVGAQQQGTAMQVAANITVDGVASTKSSAFQTIEGNTREERGPTTAVTAIASAAEATEVIVPPLAAGTLLGDGRPLTAAASAATFEQCSQTEGDSARLSNVAACQTNAASTPPSSLLFESAAQAVQTSSQTESVSPAMPTPPSTLPNLAMLDASCQSSTLGTVASCMMADESVSATAICSEQIGVLTAAAAATLTAVAQGRTFI